MVQTLDERTIQRQLTTYNDNSYNNSFEKKQPMAHYNAPHIQSDLLPCNSYTDEARFPNRRRSNGAGVVPLFSGRLRCTPG